MRLRKDVTLGPFHPVVKAAVSEAWFDDEKTNRLFGFGAGYVGRNRARDMLGFAIRKQSAGVKFLGVYKGLAPVGFFRVDNAGDHTRAVIVTGFLAPTERATGVFPTAGYLLLESLFSNGICRVEVDLLSINKGAVALLRKCGFTQEGVKRSAFWIGHRAYNIVPMRLLRKRWNRIKRERRINDGHTITRTAA